MNNAAQQRLKALADEMVSTGAESALQVAVYHRGSLIVDAWAGKINGGQAVNSDTLFPVFSTGKGIAATAIHRLVENGTLAYDRPIADYWPEFGCNGKSGITLRQALNHTAGLPHMPDCPDMSCICDWETMCRRIAGLTPLWEPGSRAFYHAITFSWLVGEPARRADGRDFQRIVEDEVCKPLGIEGLYFGIPDSVAGRVADVFAAPPVAAPLNAPPAPPPDPVSLLAIPNWVKPLEAFINRPDVRRACVPASNGIMTAKAVARHYDGVLSGELLKSSTLDQATTPCRPTGLRPDEPPMRRGLGYGLTGPDTDLGRVFGHDGHGGSVGRADRNRHLSVCVAKSKMGGDAFGRIWQALAAMPEFS